MLNKKSAIICAGAAVAAAACALAYFALRGDSAAELETSAADGASARRGRVSRPAARDGERAKRKPGTAARRATAAQRSGRRGPRPRIAAPQAPELSPEERKSLDALQDAFDREDMAAAFELARTLASCTSPAVRAKAVEVLGWFGKNAMPELVTFLADSDEDVANDAMSHFEQAIGELENDIEIAKTLIVAMKAVSDPDALESLASHFYHIEDGIAVEALSGIISAGGAAAEACKGAYEFVTGEEWIDAGTAQDWLARHWAEAADSGAAPERPDPGM